MFRLIYLTCLMLFVLCLQTEKAAAASCQAQVSDINFGAVSLRSGASNRTTGSLTVSCSNALVSVVGACIRFGTGSGGAGAGNAPRFMRNGGAQALPYQLRLAGHGAGFGTLNEVFLTVPVVLGSGQVTIPIYAEILNAGPDFDIGFYESVFSGPSHIEMSYGILSCDLFGQSHPVTDFRVSANAVASCELDIGAMNFGRISGLSNRPTDAKAAIDIRCTSGTSYTVSLGLGSGPGVTSPALRKLRNGLATLEYSLFQDAGRTQIWGDTPGTRVASTGSGLNQRFEVFGRIFSGQQTSVGTYHDSVIVTVNY